MNPALSTLLDEIERLCLEHCDEEADPADEAPEDMVAHVHGLIVQKIRKFRETATELQSQNRDLAGVLEEAMDVAQRLRDDCVIRTDDWNELTNCMWNISMAKLHGSGSTGLPIPPP